MKMRPMMIISFGTTIMTTSLPMQIRLTSFIVSTDKQREVLQEQFAKYTQHRPKIVTIPVGSIDELTESSQGRKSFSLIRLHVLLKKTH